MKGTMSLSKQKIDEIECFTWDLLKDVSHGDNIIPPIDLNRVAKFCGIIIKQGMFQDPNISGAYDKESKTIYLSDRDTYQRKAFTTAHELGHFFLHKAIPFETFYRSDMQAIDDDKRGMEQEANWFASSLLMPKPVFTAMFSITQDFTELSRRFCVSATAARYRAQNLGLIDA